MQVAPGTTRLLMGLPRNWQTVEGWLNKNMFPKYPTEETKMGYTKSCPEVPTLEDYSRDPGKEFWEKFPKNLIKKEVHTPVNVEQLKSIIESNSHMLTRSEIRRSKSLLRDLQEGACAYQKSTLPGLQAKNSNTALEHGTLLTDKIASWIKEKIIMGPFDTAPFEGFRCNPIAAIVKDGKVRPVINMSAPKGRSFNDNLLTEKIEKVWMTTAKQFGYSVREAGPKGVMSKFDLKNAYKIIPAKTCDWRLQGFSWLGKYFFETQMVFGAVPSVANFDRLGNTLVSLARSQCGIKNTKIHRTLDDIPIVAPESSGVTEKFTKVLKDMCEEVNISLAPDCELKEKAFSNETKGTVLGVNFNTVSMEWSYPEKKADKLTRRCLDAASSSQMDLAQTQKLMGSVNDVTQMCPFLKQFQQSGYRMLAQFGGNTEIVIPVQEEMKKDMLIIARVAVSSKKGLPIAIRPGLPGLEALNFYSDAAGASFSVHKGVRVNTSSPGDRGVACVGASENRVWWWSTITWPENLIRNATDGQGHSFGSKTTTLEAIGVLMPFIAIPDILKSREAVFEVDNMAVVFGWENGGVKFDTTASIILRCVHLLSAFLGMWVFLTHVPRRSNKMADLVDRLSRKSTTGDKEVQLLTGARKSSIRGVLLTWLEDPVEDWDLPMKLLEELKNSIKNK